MTITTTNLTRKDREALKSLTRDRNTGGMLLERHIVHRNARKYSRRMDRQALRQGDFH